MTAKEEKTTDEEPFDPRERARKKRLLVVVGGLAAAAQPRKPKLRLAHAPMDCRMPFIDLLPWLGINLRDEWVVWVAGCLLHLGIPTTHHMGRLPKIGARHQEAARSPG